jgi:hypothetical protein
VWAKIKKVLFMDIFSRWKPLKEGDHIKIVLYHGKDDAEVDGLLHYLNVFKRTEQPLLVKDRNGTDTYVKVEDVSCIREYNCNGVCVYTVKLKGEILK